MEPVAPEDISLRLDNWRKQNEELEARVAALEEAVGAKVSYARMRERSITRGGYCQGKMSG